MFHSLTSPQYTSLHCTTMADLEEEVVRRTMLLPIHLDPWQHPIHTAVDEEPLKIYSLFILSFSLLMLG